MAQKSTTDPDDPRIAVLLGDGHVWLTQQEVMAPIDAYIALDSFINSDDIDQSVKVYDANKETAWSVIVKIDGVLKQTRRSP